MEAEMKSSLCAHVVNVKVAHIRPRYQNLKEWCEDEENVYIGRRGIVFVDNVRYPLTDSPFANPYKVSKNLPRGEAIRMYREHIIQKIKTGEADLESLRGKTLGCWCKPEGCHGDVLIELLESGIDSVANSTLTDDNTLEDERKEGKDENEPTVGDGVITTHTVDVSVTVSPQKVKNPETNRMIMVGKGVYNNLIKKGYRLVNGELVMGGTN